MEKTKVNDDVGLRKGLASRMKNWWCWTVGVGSGKCNTAKSLLGRSERGGRNVAAAEEVEADRSGVLRWRRGLN
jgi:hypothetical protein